MNEIRLLLAEDQELIRSSLQIVLEMEEDLVITTAVENGEEALNYCEKDQPDLILMDVNMPVMNGIEATKRIKEKYPQIKIIILTTFQEMDYVIEALQAGAEGYLLKAIDTKDLVAGIRVVAKGGHLINQEVAKQLFSGYIHKTDSSLQQNADRYGLSKRELEVLRCLSDGLSNQVIAEKLFLSMGTVKNYISNLYSKLEVTNRKEALAKAEQEKLV
ncbi:response regulator transcription factor [Lysinibacillus sp. BW-2-10]|uniref:response regulator transcription factor n=1 Tax=Lysinibacillus sp. BW-2-10 TaxID=2590030 RepID=UPI00117DD009|nr:response regulator transcription factor [Lysinibacillus sp. BW-2-10]TSI03557.1 response regulator transcription factor [Lysinibacillus sp. BW-2-10]